MSRTMTATFVFLMGVSLFSTGCFTHTKERVIERDDRPDRVIVHDHDHDRDGDRDHDRDRDRDDRR